MRPTRDDGAGTQLHEPVAQALFGPQDYAVLGYKLPAEER
jgi:hypothetical protein